LGKKIVCERALRGVIFGEDEERSDAMLAVALKSTSVAETLRNKWACITQTRKLK
jgi:hypothetical protein